jgi:hypothetical protein
MSRRFQFSLGQLFSLTALTALAVWLWSLIGAPGRGVVGISAVAAHPVAIGSAVGQLFGKPFKGAGLVIGFYLLVASIVAIVLAVGHVVSMF